MEHLLSGLNSLLAIKPKQGSLLLLLGGSTLALYVADVWPFSKIPETWITIAALVALSGLVVLLVWLCSSVATAISAGRSQARDRATRQAKRKQADAEANENVDLLSRPEQEALKWILLQNKQRFQADYGSYTAENLRRKNLIHQDPRSQDSNIHLVRQAIWEQREDILAKMKFVDTLSDAPWR